MFKKVSILALTLAISLDTTLAFAKPKKQRASSRKRVSATKKIKSSTTTEVQEVAPVVDTTPVVEAIPVVTAVEQVEPAPAQPQIINNTTNDLNAIKLAVREELQANNELLKNANEIQKDTKVNEEIAKAKSDLATKIDEVKVECSGIKSNLDTIFGLSVATTVSSGLGTLAAGGALGLGITKDVMEKKAEQKAVDNANRDFSAEFTEWKTSLNKMKDDFGMEENDDPHAGKFLSSNELMTIAQGISELASNVNKKYKDLDKAMKQSQSDLKKAEGLSDEEKTSFLNASHDELANAIKVAFEDMDKIDETTYKEVATKTPNTKVLGHVRTGLMAGATATSLVSTGTSIGATVTASKLAEKMSSCNAKLSELKIAKNTLIAVLEDAEQPSTIATADNILNACTGYDEANIKTLKTTMTASAVVSGIGSAVAGAGTVTSIMANTDKTRNDDSEKGQKKEKALNLTTNILAGVATGTSGASTVLSATAISRAKKDSEMAGNCESVLAQ